MKTITIAVPEDEIKSLYKFLQQSNITVIDETDDDDDETTEWSSEIIVEELQPFELQDSAVIEQLEKELEKEIWKLHHFDEAG